MDKAELKKQYFGWLCKFVGCYSRRELLYFLFNAEFKYTHPMDANRYEDGINLRYRFADEHAYHYRYIAAWLDDAPCSMLEMMVALVDRMEHDIASDPEYGDRTGRWFEDMLKSMGLWHMTDERFDYGEAVRVLDRVLSRRYSRNGEGGLFHLRHCKRDLRSAEIWYQAMWYLDEKLCREY